jgi:hypothetical protein
MEVTGRGFQTVRVGLRITGNQALGNAARRASTISTGPDDAALAVSTAGVGARPILAAAAAAALTTGLLDGGDGLDFVAAGHPVELVDREFEGFNVRIVHVFPLSFRRDHSLMHGGRREYTARFI